MRCPQCGSRIITDYKNGVMVCPACGLVLEEPVVVPPVSFVNQSAPLLPSSRSGTGELVETLTKVLVEELDMEPSRANRIAVKVSKLPAKYRDVVANYVVEIARGRASALMVNWNIAKKIGETLNLIGVTDARDRLVHAAFIEEAGRVCPGVDVEKLWDLALRYKRLWGGRKARSIARGFASAVCLSAGKHPSGVGNKALKIAKAIMAVIPKKELASTFSDNVNQKFTKSDIPPENEKHQTG